MSHDLSRLTVSLRHSPSGPAPAAAARKRGRRRSRRWACAFEWLEDRLVLSSAPTVTNGVSSALPGPAWTLNGTVNPNGSSTNVQFQYSTSPYFIPTVQTTVGGGFSQPSGVTVDAFGDVFVADYNNAAVKEVLPNGTINTIGSGFSDPTGVAVDASGDVFVTDQNYGISKVVPSGTVTFFTGFVNPVGVAVDASGDVFVADTGYSAIKEILPNGTIKSIGSGFNSPSGVAVDASGDVFVADTGNSLVKEVPQNANGTYGAPVTLASGVNFNGPTGVAVDASGDVFVADKGNKAVKEVLPDHTTVKTLGSGGFSAPAGVAVDGVGDLFVADTQYTAAIELMPPSVAATPSPLTGSTAQAVSATPTGLAYGTLYYDRAVAANGSGMAAGSPADSFTTPPAPTITNVASNTITATGAMLNGTVNPNGSSTTVEFQYATNPQFTPFVQTTVGAGIRQLDGLAVDAAGDVFVSALGNLFAEEVLPNGTYNTIGSGLFNQDAVAVDASGDLFVTIYTPGAVKEVLPNGTVKTIGSGFRQPEGVAVDASGDVFVADTGNNAVKEVLANGTITTIGSGFSGPFGVAVDASGDVFVADTGNNAVKKVLPNGAINTLGYPLLFKNPEGLALDASGDLFVADLGNSGVKEVLPDGTITTIGSGFKSPVGVAVDASGDVFVADASQTHVVKLTLPTVTVTPSPLTGTTAQAVSATVTGLAPGTRYYDRVAAANGYSLVVGSNGPVAGNSDFFTTLPAPSVVNTAASLTATGATVNANLNPEGLSTAIQVQYSTSPQFRPTISSNVGSGFNNPSGVAVDASGDVFVADTGNNAIEEVLPNGTINTIGSGFNAPTGVAVDASGNVFVADTGNSLVKEVLPNGTINTIGSGFNAPTGVAVDASGNIFVADTGHNAIKMIQGLAITTISSAFNGPSAVAVDASDDLFVADTGNNAVKEIQGLFSPTITPLGSGFNGPTGVALDASGDVFVADTGNKAVKEVLPAGTVLTLNFRLGQPRGVALDASGDVFDTQNTQAVELSPPAVTSTPSALTGTTAQAVSAMLAGLAPDRVYYDRFVAVSNGYGTVIGSPTWFATGPNDQMAVTVPPTSVTAGTAFGTTIQVDYQGNLDTYYNGPVTLSLAANPGSDTLTGTTTVNAVGGIATFTNLVLDKASAGDSLQISSGVADSITTATFPVAPAAASQFAVTGFPATTAGSPQSLTVTALDAYGNVATDYAGTVQFTSSDAQAVLPANYTFVAGNDGPIVFYASVITSGTQTITATDTSNGAIVGTQSGIAVSPGATLTFVVRGPTTSTVAGTPLVLTVEAVDGFGNLTPTYTGDVHLKSDDTKAQLPPDYTFTAAAAGQHTFAVTPETAQTAFVVRATDTANATVTGATNGVTVTPAAPSVITLGFPASAQAGTTLGLKVAVSDAYGNVATGYTGTLQITSTDARASLSSYTFTSSDAGKHVFNVVFKTAGVQALTATDTANASLTGSRLPITVTAAGAQYLVISDFPTASTAGASQGFLMAVTDAYGNAVPSYAGTVRFTSNDSKAILPPNYTFTSSDAGLHAFAATLVTAGPAQAIRATDTVHGSITGITPSVVLSPAAASVLVVGSSASALTAGGTLNVPVTMSDAYGNAITGYTGTVHFTSTDPQAGLPADYMFTAADAGKHTFAVTLKTAGSQAIAATDTATASLTGTHSGLAVSAAGAQNLVFSKVTTATTAGIAQGFLVSVTDAFGNPVPSYAGTVHFTSNDTRAILPADYTFTGADAGVHAFAATLETAGTSDVVRATDIVHGSITGLAPTVTVSAAAAVKVVVSGFPSTASVGTAYIFQVALYDAYGNVATGYLGTIQFASDDPTALLPGSYPFTASDAGKHTFTATFRKAGTHSLKASDANNASLSGSETGIVVS
jgi:sugar lactone lactonase YvrE